MNISYNSFNFCIKCEIKYPKSTVKCTQCGKKIRTIPRYSWKNKTKMKFLCSNCNHIYGNCACICCRADEDDPE
jgi:hypothetical protein